MDSLVVLVIGGAALGAGIALGLLLSRLERRGAPRMVRIEAPSASDRARANADLVDGIRRALRERGTP